MLSEGVTFEFSGFFWKMFTILSFDFSKILILGFIEEALLGLRNGLLLLLLFNEEKRLEDDAKNVWGLLPGVWNFNLLSLLEFSFETFS